MIYCCFEQVVALQPEDSNVVIQLNTNNGKHQLGSWKANAVAWSLHGNSITYIEAFHSFYHSFFLARVKEKRNDFNVLNTF